MKKFTKAKAIIAGAAVAVLGLTGCAANGGGSESGGDDTPFVYVIGSNPAHLNAALNTDVTTGQVASAILEPLLLLTRDAQLEPALAASWEQSDDATQFTLNLEEGVTWHDGEPFTSADVKFNLEEIIPLHPLGSWSGKIASIETPDETTVEITTKEPYSPFLAALTAHRMIPAHLYEGTEIVTNPANTAPVGTGPFKFVSFDAGDRVVVEKYEDYWGESGDVNRVIFTIMPDTNARSLALQAGEVDAVAGTWLDVSQMDVLKKDDKLHFSPNGNQPSVMTLFMNTREGPLAEYDVRKALFMAMDREEMVDKVYSGRAVAARGPIPASLTWAVNDDIDFMEMFPHDADAAAELLDEAGYPAGADGTRFTVRVAAPSGLPTFIGTAEVVKSNLEEIGVKVDLVVEDLSVFVEKTYTNHDFDMSIMGFGSYQDPALGVARLYECNPTNKPFANPTGICDPEMDQAFIDAAQVSDLDERKKHFGIAETRAAELLGTVPLNSDAPENALRQDRWSGVEDFNNYMWEDWRVISHK